MANYSVADAARQWALKCAEAERQFRHGKSMADIREALEMLPHFDLAAAAAGELPPEVTALPQYDRINRGVGEARGRTIALASDLLAERDSDLTAWLEACHPDTDWVPECPCGEESGPEGLCGGCEARGIDPADYGPASMREEVA